MKGELLVQSEPGQWARFFFTLRLQRAAEVDSGKSLTPEQRVKQLRNGNHVRALIADDIAENREILGRLLRELGAEVAVVERGEEAWAELRVRRYDVAFLDIQMPGLTGTEAAERVLSELGRGRVKLVAISASVLTHEQKQYAEKGFDAFVPKPFRFEQVCECLRDLLGVEFEYQTDQPIPNAKATGAEANEVAVPPELWARLKRAAEIYSVTEFEGFLPEMEALGPAGRELAGRLREHSRNVKMDEILRILDNLRPGGQA